MARVIGDPDVADPLDPGVRPGMEHGIVQDAIDGDRGADAKRERKDCGEAEGRGCG